MKLELKFDVVESVPQNEPIYWTTELAYEGLVSRPLLVKHLAVLCAFLDSISIIFLIYLYSAW